MHTKASTDLLVHGVVTCKTGTGEQSASYQSKVRYCQNPNRRATNKKQITATLDPTPQETCEWSYALCIAIFYDTYPSNDGSRILRRTGTRLHKNCTMFTNSAVEEDPEWCATTFTRCCMAEYVRGEGHTARRSIRQIMWRVKSIRGNNWKGLGTKFSWGRDVP